MVQNKLTGICEDVQGGRPLCLSLSKIAVPSMQWQPTFLELGADTAITDTGSLDKAESGATYDMELKAGGGLMDSHFTGNNCEAKIFDFPLGFGKLSWDGLSAFWPLPTACPLASTHS